MKTKTTLLGYYTLITIVLALFLNANSNSHLKYTPYQILVWEIKANEGYRPWWYKDGWNKGKQAYSIGFGWNDLGQRRRGEIQNFTKDRKVTFDEAMTITLMEIKKYGKLHKDPLRNLALQLYSYNCGPVKSGASLGRCCKAAKWCGSSNPDVRKMHKKRRQFELALWNHDYVNIIAHTEKNRKTLQTYLQILKSRGDI